METPRTELKIGGEVWLGGKRSYEELVLTVEPSDGILG